MRIVKGLIILLLVIFVLLIGGIALFWLADVIPALKAIFPLAAFVIAAYQVFDELKAFKEER